MKNLKFAIIALGLVGLIGAFLPFLDGGEAGSASLWDLKAINAGQVYLTMGSFVVAAIAGGLAVATGLVRWHAILATVAFALAVVKNRENMDLAMGAKIMLISAALGLLVSIIAIVKPEKA